LSVDRRQFLTLVAEGSGLDDDAAERATRATLQTLAERITRGEADDLAAVLAPELAAWLHKPGPAAESFDAEEFLRRTAERSQLDLATAERAARAVFTALQHAVPRKELDDVAAQLPRDLARLLPRGATAGELGADDFVARVGELTGLDTSAARRAAEAVLETLAERISGGEVEDLIVRLPRELHPPLKVGSGLSSGVARKMSLDEFVQRIAEREGVSASDAREHARAVLSVLREATGDEEFFDVTSELPDEYAPVLARR
jgi:uncharacterized protein (DUF2267 family)